MTKPKQTTVTDLTVQRVDLVDVGASLAKGSDEGAHVLLYKRAAQEPSNVREKGDRMQESKLWLLLKAISQKVGLSPEDVQKMEGEAQTFDDAMLRRKMSEIYSDMSDHMGALMETVESIMMSEEGDKPALLKDAMNSFHEACLARVSEWIGTVTKEGRKISDSRLKKLKEMWGALDAVIAEAEGRATKKLSAKGEPMDRTQWPEEVRKHVEGIEAQLAEAKAVIAKAAQPKESEDEAAVKSLPESVRKRVEAAEKRAQEAESVAKAERDERLKAGYLAKAASYKGLPIQAEEDWSVFKAIAEKLEKSESERILSLLKAADEAIVAGKLFAEVGTTGSDSGTGAYAQIDTLAKDLMSKSANPLTIEQARVKIMEQRPDLYRQAREEGGQS